MKHYLFDVYPFFVAGMWLFSMYLVAVTGGWRLLARRFRMENAYPGQKWTMQSARMSWLARYNRCLTIGAFNAWIIYHALSVDFEPGTQSFLSHGTKSQPVTRPSFLVFNMVELRLGRSEEFPSGSARSWLPHLKPPRAAAGPRDTPTPWSHRRHRLRNRFAEACLVRHGKIASRRVALLSKVR